jgi:NAD(P)-dependent dehydrogenase (short-subunit alcohol dehydrogenase family)
LAALSSYVRSTHYAASKHGVVGLTRSAALQYRDKEIRINAVCPGMIMTPMIERAFALPGVEDWFRSKVPGRGGNPDEVAQAVTWLCSDAASYVTGVALPVDGVLSSGM